MKWVETRVQRRRRGRTVAERVNTKRNVSQPLASYEMFHLIEQGGRLAMTG